MLPVMIALHRTMGHDGESIFNANHIRRLETIMHSPEQQEYDEDGHMIDPIAEKIERCLLHFDGRSSEVVYETMAEVVDKIDEAIQRIQCMEYEPVSRPPAICEA
jgi:uncharacterized protein YlzI (FlbEa/FlbD family)